MKKIRTKTSEFSEEEVTRFNKMHKILKAYNRALGTKNELPLPRFTSEEMGAYSVFREILIAETSE
jgi:hypothetical protein